VAIQGAKTFAVPATARRVACALVPVLGSLASAHAGLPDKAYTLKELLDRAAIIVIARVVEDGPAAGGKAALREGLLAVSHVMRGEGVPEELRFRVEGPPLPVSASAIWFLTPPGPDGIYVIDHPQCAYDVSHRAVVEKALKDPSRVSPGYYLRREDELLAARVRAAREMRALATVAAGRSPEGLELSVRLRPSLRARGGEAPGQPADAGKDFIALEFVLKNAGGRELLVCDSTEECYFLRVEREGRAEVVRAVEETPLPPAAAELGSLVSVHDFVHLEPGGRLVHNLDVRRGSSPLLRAAGGARLSGVYRYAGPGREDLRLPSEPWRGAVASSPFDVALPEPEPGSPSKGKDTQ